MPGKVDRSYRSNQPLIEPTLRARLDSSMFSSVTVPLWVAVVAGLLSFLWIVDKLILPAVRRIVDRRHRRVLGQVDRRLRIHIQPFRLTKHRVLVDRLMNDEEIRAAIRAWAEQPDVSDEQAEEQAERYAREIVPAFNAYFYFKTGYVRYFDYF